MIGITVGEHFGVGYEILGKLLATPIQTPIHIYGDSIAFSHSCQVFQTKVHPENKVTWKDIPCKAKTKSDEKLRGRYVLDQLEAAADDGMAKNIQGLLTCPIDKNIVALARERFDGHTRFLQELTNAPTSIMVMQNQDYNIVVGTQHIALRDVPVVFNRAHFETLIDHLLLHAPGWLGKSTLKIACLGLNPHAGELDPTSEENTWMADAIKLFQEKGVIIEGPFPADSFFGVNKNKGWDLVVSPYHDQALVAAKYNGLQEVVNVTLGLPFLRTSPGHGVAYDIAGTNQSNPASLISALTVLQKALGLDSL